MRSPRAKIVGSVLALSLALSGAASQVASASPRAASVRGGGASTAGYASADFYTPPSPLPRGRDGDLIRTQPAPLAWSVPWSPRRLPATATRIMYRSEDTHGSPVAVTGTYFDPALPWHGPGPRPLVSLAPATQGQGAQCAPSRLVGTVLSYQPPFGLMAEYEVAPLSVLLAQGMAVVMTDYRGLGTPGVHTFANRLDEAHAVLDAARAAQRLPGTEVPHNGPVGLWGYSQGGGASAAAAELAPSYAPELAIKGTYAGGPPADLEATLDRVDGGSLSGAIGYALNGLVYAYPQLGPVIAANTNAAGKAMLAGVAHQCLIETVLSYGFHRSTEYTTDGRSFGRLAQRVPMIHRILEENSIGSLKPDAPVLILAGTDDDIAPYDQARQLAAKWCAKGAGVDFRTVDELPILPGSGIDHVIPFVVGVLEALQWMNQRFADQPFGAGCSIG